LPGAGVEPDRPLLIELEAEPPTEEGVPTPPDDADPVLPADDPLPPDEELELPDEPPPWAKTVTGARARAIVSAV
jgi:hypothetical protein